MLMIMLAMIVPAVNLAAAPQQKADEATCRAEIILISKAQEADREAPEKMLLPRDKAGAKGPAVLTPRCTPDERKKKDYPMA